jgi:gamma-butyrobetaine dioxygenase
LTAVATDAVDRDAAARDAVARDAVDRDAVDRDAVTGEDMVTEIMELFRRFGGERYGEDLSLEDHMLQSAVRARALGATDALVVAALLHDVGHFLVADAEAAIADGLDLGHEALGSAWLSRAFGEDVTAPIALHVAAKRYLCAVEPDYVQGLSQASRLSLVVQGGVMNASEAAAFARHPAFEAALLLRRCDDAGKDPSLVAPPIETWRGLMTAALRPDLRRRPDRRVLSARPPGRAAPRT